MLNQVVTLKALDAETGIIDVVITEDFGQGEFGGIVYTNNGEMDLSGQYLEFTDSDIVEA